jgi:histidine triad (HIT) family protein
MYNHEPENYTCPFCIYVSDSKFKYQVYKDDYLCAFISSAMWPNNPGIVIIIPNKHIENVYDMPDTLLGEIHILAKKIALAMKTSYRCHGISMRQHNEPAGNQEVMHYHFQVIPRYNDDNLYINHKKKSDIPSAERLRFAELLKKSL